MRSVQKDDLGMEYTRKVDDILSVDSRERMLQEFIICPFIQSICTNKDVVPVDIKVSGKCHNYKLYCGKYGYTKDNILYTVIETPDLCVANDWSWINDNKIRNDYTLTVEIKTVYSDNEYWISPGYINNQIVIENSVEDITEFINSNMLSKNSDGNYFYAQDEKYQKSIQKQIGIHLRGINKVIATDGVRWIFFYKNEDNSCCALPPIDLGKRLCKKARKKYKHVKIDWNFEDIIIKGKCLGTRLKNYELLKYVIYEFCDRKVSNMAELVDIINKRIERFN